jgi:hypothetical protein
VGLQVDGAGRRANKLAPRALLGVHLHEKKRPEQMLWAALLWAQVVPDKEIPEDLHNPHAHSKDLAEVMCLHQCCPIASRLLVLDFPGDQDKVRGVIVLVLFGVAIGRITGGHSCNHCSGGVEEGRGRWEGEIGVVCCVV